MRSSGCVIARTLICAPDLKACGHAWEACQFTGYGEGVRWVAREMFGIDEITAESIERAAPAALAMHKPGERLRILRDVAGLDHVQIDDFSQRSCPMPAAGSSFCMTSRGRLDQRLYQTQRHPCADWHPCDRSADAQTAFQKTFEIYGARAIAIKTQHAYARTLHWRGAREPMSSARCARRSAARP